MERVRQRKTRTPTVIEGNQQVRKHKTVPKLVSENSSCSRGITKEDLGRSSSKRVTGVPMKKLLAEEMSKETDAKRQSPSVIAKLMGLDGLPSWQPVHIQQKRLLDDYQQRTAPIGFQRNVQLYEGRSNRKSSIEQQEFKDVYEDLEASHVANRHYSLKQTANLNLRKPEMVLIQQKFIDAKHLSTYESVQGSKEFHDTLDMLDSNKDLMLKFLQQPDSLFVKHVCDLKGAPPSSLCSHVPVLKPSDSVRYEANAKRWKSERGASRKQEISSRRKHEDVILSQSYNGRRAQNSPKSSKNRLEGKDVNPLKSSKIRLEGKDDTDILPTRIVVLKPNLEKAYSAIQSVSSPDSSHAYLSDCRKHTEYSSVGTREAGSWGKKDLTNDAGFSRPKSREAREIAKKITRQMRNAVGSRPANLLYSGIGGYAGDESSYSISGSDTAGESVVMTPTSRNSFDWNYRYKPSSAGSPESSLSREAKKRLSERWKMTHMYQDVGVVGKGSTLGEMLASAEREMRPDNLDAMMGLDETSDRFASSNVTSELDNPLGISSRDGWKDGKSSRSRSLPRSSFGSRSPKTSAQREVFADDSLLMPKEAMNQSRAKAVKENFNTKEDYSSKNLRSSINKSQSTRHRYSCSTDSLPEIHPSQNQMQINLDKNDLSEQQPRVCQIPDGVTSTSSAVDAVVNAKQGITIMHSDSSDEFLPELSMCVLRNGNSSACDQEDSNSQELSIGPYEGGSVVQCPGPSPESSESSKEADHPSPVSVLEVPSVDDVSSGSECFERVSAELHELRMQLQLLKMESEACAEVPMLIPGDENGQESVIVSEERVIIRKESWKSSYLVDILIESGFNDTDPDMFMTTWNSPNCPLGPTVFDNLEKKYNDEANVPRYERRLLFDRINSAFLEIFQWFTDPRGKPMAIGVGLKWQKRGVKDELQKLLARQEKEADEDISVNVLDREMHWLDFGDNGADDNGDNDIGMEIEKLLIDDLLTEVVMILEVLS